MTESVKTLTFINVLFVLLLIASGSFPGFIGSALYYLAFIIPIAIGFSTSVSLKYKREEIKGIAEPLDRFVSFDKSAVGKLLCLIAPVVLLIFLTSLLSSFMLSLVGVSAKPVEDTGIVNMLLVHALVPAVFEEALFRYIPMKLVLPYSRKWCVIYSAICFALIHCSFVQMPYAFVAGILFMIVDVALGSVWPSVILHFVNNAVSVVWMKYCGTLTASLIFVSSLVILSLVSLIFILRKREEYLSDVRGAFDKGEGFPATYAPFALVAVCCCLAAATL